MCKAADEDVDYHDYDWDGDGEAEEVFVIYAGKGEADTGTKNLIWPHMWTFTEAIGGKLELDSVKIDIYACANELTSNSPSTASARSVMSSHTVWDCPTCILWVVMRPCFPSTTNGT